MRKGSTTILTRWYPSNSYIKETAGGVTKEYTLIGGTPYNAPVVAVTQSGTTTYYDLLRDYLGSITHVVNASTGSVVNEYSFDAWGRMRNPSTWVNYAPGSDPALFIGGRGFTGHEHLPWFNLINMNGRAFDPLVGMFLSADNYLQNPASTQNFNRYSYCLNNPLKYSDPSGMLAKARDEEGDAEFDAYFSWLCDASMSFGNMAGGGGGGGASLDGAAGWDRDASSSRMNGVRWNGLGYVDRLNGDAVSYNEVMLNYILPFSKGSISIEMLEVIISGEDCSYRIMDKGIETTQTNFGGVNGLTKIMYETYPTQPKLSGQAKNGGVQIKLSYRSTTGEWEQLISTNSPDWVGNTINHQVSPYWDSDDGTRRYPYQYIENNATVFYDSPGRPSDCYWHSDLYFNEPGRGNILHLTYGFSIVNGVVSAVPLRVVP